eukprot:16302750-Heterocapsa_arctica.AAC.1
MILSLACEDLVTLGESGPRLRETTLIILENLSAMADKVHGDRPSVSHIYHAAIMEGRISPSGTNSARAMDAGQQ